MIPQMIAFDSEEDFNDFLASMAMLGMPCQVEEPKEKGKQNLTGGSVNYYTVKVKDQPVECGDVMDALQLTAHEYNIFKEIWRTANARLGNGKPGHTALYGAEKVAYYANRILGAEKQKA